MAITGRFILLLTLLACFCSCHRIVHGLRKLKQELEPKAVKYDTTALMHRVMRYEPQKYKGKVPPGYYTYDGIFDWYRFPLVYPYAIISLDVAAYGTVVSDSGIREYGSGGGAFGLSPPFNALTFDSNMLVAQKCREGTFERDSPPYVEQYFIFLYYNTQLLHVSGRDNLNRRLNELHFSGDTAFMSLKKYRARLWGIEEGKESH